MCKVRQADVEQRLFLLERGMAPLLGLHTESDIDKQTHLL
jgi:hypothetical protein